MTENISPVFALRHKPTGNWLPATRYGKGASFDEPLPLAKCPRGPRLFFNYQSARNALIAWLQGQYSKVSPDFNLGQIFSDDNVRYAYTPIQSRKREEMEIVEFSLQETRSLQLKQKKEPQ